MRMPGEEHIEPQSKPREVSGKIAFAIHILDFFAAILILFLALMLVHQRPWFVELSANFIGWALVPSVPMLIILSIMRRWRSVAMWIIPALAFTVLFGELFLPSFGSSQLSDKNTGSENLKVMTWNMYGSIFVDRQPQLDILKNSGADIVALQEVTKDGVYMIDKQLADLYPYRILMPKDTAGSGLLSKFPIVSQDIFQAEPSDFYCVKAVLDVNGDAITVISAHPAPHFLLLPRLYRTLGSDEIKNILKKVPEGEPVLLMGDFNLTDQSLNYKLLAESELHDTFREIGWGFGTTWPVHFHRLDPFPSLIRIDYIWHSKEFEPVSIKVGQKAISDHLPVIAELVYAH